MSKGNGHKEGCMCSWCSGESGFQKGNTRFQGKDNPMYGVKRTGLCKWTSERNRINKGEKNSFFGCKHTEKTKEVLRKRIQKRILLNGGAKIGRNEKDALDQLEKQLCIKIIRQYPTCGYFVDGYCKEKNIVFEVDEKHHISNRQKDWEREQVIKNKLNCKIVRIKDHDEELAK